MATERMLKAGASKRCFSMLRAVVLRSRCSLIPSTVEITGIAKLEPFVSFALHCGGSLFHGESAQGQAACTSSGSLSFSSLISTKLSFESQILKEHHGSAQSTPCMSCKIYKRLC